jgi:(4-alkanoyl-5-oxo-2,5-dihydrofuran-3-yl)methyl phosphate reductase
MILVFGATGMVGGEVARQLIAIGETPRLLVRDPSKAHPFEGQAEIMRGDLADSRSLADALKGIDAVFLVTGTYGGIDPDLEANAIDAATHASVKHVVKLSVVGADDPIDTFGKLHSQLETKLRHSGLAWTMVRPHYFMTNTLRWADTIRSQSAVYYPTADGRWAAIDPGDIAAVAVKALTEAGHAGRAYTVSGPESLTAAQYVEKLSAAIGKPIKFINVPLEAVRDEMRKSGMPDVHADALKELLGTMRANRLDVVADGVPAVLGRQATTFDEWARRNAAAFS